MRQLKIKDQITERSDKSINLYFDEIKKYPIITVEEEAEVSSRIRNGDEEAVKKLVVANLRFVISVAKQYQNQGLSLSDLINEGNLGLIRAAKKFDETRGFKFISYAVWWIRQAIAQAISNQTRTVRLPLNRISSINKVSKAIPYLEQEFLREPTDDEIAGHLNMDHDEIILANEIKKRQLSFDVPVLTDNNDEISMYDKVQNENIPSPDSNLMDESLAINVSRVLNKLNKREAEVLTMSFGLCSTQVHSLHDIALLFNMSSERIRQIRNRAICRLRIMAKDKNSLF